MDKYFIRVFDPELADKFTKAGFQLINRSGNVFTFLNNGTINFDCDNGKVDYTDSLNI